eukprot:SAG11_NODE_1575_length_4659_cov_2.048904_3_plen_52_part_00
MTADANGDIFRGLEVVEHCCAMGAHMMGDSTEQVLYWSPLPSPSRWGCGLS